MKEYRAQLDADRAQRLSKGTNHANLRVKADDMKSKVGPILSRQPCTQPFKDNAAYALKLLACLFA